MTGRVLGVNVLALGEDGRYQTFLAGTEVSEKVAEGITREDVWAEGADDDGPKPYAKWRKADLEDEVAKRNDGRAEDSPLDVGKGTVADLAAALDADDAAQS